MVKDSARSYLCRVFGAEGIPGHLVDTRLVFSFKNHEYFSPSAKRGADGKIAWNHSFVINMEQPLDSYINNMRRPEIEIRLQDTKRHSLMRREASSLDLGLSRSRSGRRSIDRESDGSVSSPWTTRSKTPKPGMSHSVGDRGERVASSGIATAVCSGTFLIKQVTESKNDKIFWVDLLDSKGGSCGRLAVGWFRTIVRTPTENRAVRKKKWFEKKADKESRQMEKKIDRLIDFIFGGDTLKKLKPVVQNATGAEAEAKVMYELMRIVKTQEGREQFVYKLDPSRLPAKAAKRIGSCIAIQSRRTFEFLSVLVKAALREGVYTRDFQLNKVLMDVSYFYHYFDKEKKAHMFLYLEIAHEQTYSQSLEFWESAFVSSEQVVNPIVEDDTTSEIYKREVAESCKMRVIDLVDVFLAQMTIFSDVSSPKTLGLADKMCFMFDISEESIKNLHKEVEEREEFRDIFETPATRPKKESKLELRKKGKHAVKHSMADVQVKLGGILQQSQWVRYRTDAGLFFHNRETNQISDFPPPHSIFEDSTIAGKQVHVTKSSSEYLFREVKLGVIGECWMQTRVGQTASWQQNMGKYRSIQGTMVVTNYRVEFNSFEGEPWMNEMIPVHAMDRFELDVFTVTTAVGQKEMQVMVFHTKDYRTLKVTAAFSKDLAKLLKRIKKLAFPKSVTGLFAFTFRQPVAHADDGWQIFDVEREMARQGALEAGWRICDINKDFTFSPTYPQRLVMPDFVKDQDLPAMAKFRSKKRMPALTYYLARKKVSMLRSSQPMVGLTGNRGKEEEWMLQELRLTSIFDARPTENAFANKAKGGGYEDPRFYTRRGDAKCEIHFCDIHNIHRMRSSLAQVTIACESQLVRRSDEYWDLILKSKWVAHVRNMVMQSYRLAQTMLDGETVLVHCSDGWDRTAQMCCLAQVCLDRYFRTIEGLSVLIEKDWCSFGHQFHKRIGHGSSKFSDSDRSPIFVQFLDGLWQMWKQAPDRFEYNERIFEYLAEEVVACKFGTFLFDNERQRVEHQLKQRTVSVWTYVCKTNKADFLNPLYQPNLDMPQVANMSLSKSRKNLHSGDQENKDCEFLQLNMDPRLFEVWPYYYRQDAHLIRNFRGTGKYNGRPRNSEPGWIGEHILSLVKAKGKLQIDWLSNRVTDLERKLKEAEQKLTTHRREEAKKDHLHKTPPRLKNATSQDSWRDKSTQPTIVSTKSVASTTPSIPFPRTITQTSVASSTMAVQDVDCSNSITSPNNLSAEEEEKEKEKKQQPGASSSPTPTTPSPHDTKSEAGAPLPGARRRIVDRRPNHTYPIPPVGPGQDAPPLEARWRAPSNNHRPGQQQKQQQPRSQTEAAIMAAALAMQKKRRAKPGGGGGGGDKGQGSPSTSRGTTKQKKAFSLPGVERQHHPHPGPPPATNSHWRRQRQQQRQEKHQKKQFGFNSTAPPPVVDAQKSKEAAAPEGAATPPTGRRTPPPFRKKKIRAKSKAKEETTTATGKRTVRNGKGASKARKFFVALQQRQQKPQGGGGEAAPPPRKPPVASHAHSHSAAAAGSCASSSPKPRPCHRPVYSQMPHLSSDAPPPPPPEEEEEEEQEGGARKIHVRQYQLKSQTKMGSKMAGSSVAQHGNSSINVSSQHWVPIRRPLPGIPSSAYSDKGTMHAPQSPWEEKQSVSSAMAIAATVQTAKTYGSEIDEESPRSTSPNPSTALPSHRSHSPTEASSVMAVGERHMIGEDNSSGHWELAPPKEGKDSGRIRKFHGKAPLPPSSSSKTTSNLAVRQIITSRGDGMGGHSSAPVPPSMSGARSSASFDSADKLTNKDLSNLRSMMHESQGGNTFNLSMVMDQNKITSTSLETFATAPTPPDDEDEDSDTQQERFPAGVDGKEKSVIFSLAGLNSGRNRDKKGNAFARKSGVPPPPPDDDCDELESPVASLPTSERGSVANPDDEARIKSTSMTNRGVEVSNFDWSATIKPSELAGKRDFFVSVRRSTVGGSNHLPSANRPLAVMSEISEDEGKSNVNPLVNDTPPPPPDSDDESDSEDD